MEDCMDALRSPPTQTCYDLVALLLYVAQFTYFSLAWTQVKIYESIHLAECLAINTVLL